MRKHHSMGHISQCIDAAKVSLQPGEEGVIMEFNGLEIFIYRESHPPDIGRIYDLMHRIRRLKAGHREDD